MKRILIGIAALSVLAVGGWSLGWLSAQPNWDAYNDCFPHWGADYCAERYHIPSAEEWNPTWCKKYADADFPGCEEYFPKQSSVVKQPAVALTDEPVTTSTTAPVEEPRASGSEPDYECMMRGYSAALCRDPNWRQLTAGSNG